MERKAPEGLEDLDSKYLGMVLGDALIIGLSEVVQCRPWDPIEHLAQWLYQHDRNLRNKEQVRKYDVRKIRKLLLYNDT